MLYRGSNVDEEILFQDSVAEVKNKYTFLVVPDFRNSALPEFRNSVAEMNFCSFSRKTKQLAVEKAKS